MGCASSTVVEANRAHPDFFDNYVLGVKIGKGAFAQVRVATKSDNTEFRSIDSDMEGMPRERAVKILDLGTRKDDRKPQMLQLWADDEVRAWKHVGCNDHCVRLYDFFFDPYACYMVMEKCESSLLEHLECMPELNERTLGGIFVQMLKGIEHLHSFKIVHRDVKPPNFLIGSGKGSVIKLSDFGVASKLCDKSNLRGVYGSPPFMAPEMLQQLPYAHKIDVWSFGVIAYTLFFGSLPYEPKSRTSTAMKTAILQGLRPKFRAWNWNDEWKEQKLSDCATAFVKAVLVRDPKTRPTASEALQLPFMVAVMEDSHMLEVDLPDLRATVQQSKTIGVFEIRDLCKKSQLDIYLNKMHFARHNEVLPGFEHIDLHEGMTNALNTLGADHSKLQEDSGVGGGFPCNDARLQSNPWDKTSDSTSCGSSRKGSNISSKSSNTISSQTTQIFV